MGLVWSLLELPLDFFFPRTEDFRSPYRLGGSSPRALQRSPEVLLIQAALIAAHHRQVMGDHGSGGEGRIAAGDDPFEREARQAEAADSETASNQSLGFSGDSDINARSELTDEEDDTDDKSTSASDSECSESEFDAALSREPRTLAQEPIGGFHVGTSQPHLDAFLLDTRVRCGMDSAPRPTSWVRGTRSRELRVNRLRSFKADCLSRTLPNRHRYVDEDRRTKTFCCRFLKNEQIMTASQDGSIRFFSREGSTKGRYHMIQRLMVPCYSWSVLDVAVSPDGETIAYGTWKDEVFIARMQEPKEERNFVWHRLQVPRSDETLAMALFQLKFSRDGEEILCASSNQRIYAFNLETGQCTLDLHAHEDDVNAICYGDTNHLVYSAADDGLCKVWDRRTMSENLVPAGTFAGHKDGITSVDSRADNRYVVTNSKDQTIKIWDLRRFATESGVNRTRESVGRQRWDYRWHSVPQVNRAVAPGDVSVCTLWGHTVRHTLIRAHFSPPATGQRYVYTGCANGRVFVYDVVEQKVATVLSGGDGNVHKSVVRECDWCEESNEIVTSGWDGRTLVWNYDARFNSGYSAMSRDGDCSTDEYYNPKPTRSRAQTASRKRRVPSSIFREVEAIRSMDSRGERDEYDTDME